MPMSIVGRALGMPIVFSRSAPFQNDALRMPGLRDAIQLPFDRLQVGEHGLLDTQQPRVAQQLVVLHALSLPRQTQRLQNRTVKSSWVSPSCEWLQNPALGQYTLPLSFSTLIRVVAGSRPYTETESSLPKGIHRSFFMASRNYAVTSTYDDVWLIDGVRTPFVDYNGALGGISTIDMGIKVGREVFKRSGVAAADVGAVIVGNMAQTCFDVYVQARHVGLYSGVPQGVPALQVQRVCGTGVEALAQAADNIALGKIELGLVVGMESMSRNPIAAYNLRGGMLLGQVEMKDFLYEALTDTSCDSSMGDCAEYLAREYKLTRSDADQFAFDSFQRALAAQASGFLAGEIVPVVNEEFALDGYNTRGIKLPRKVESAGVDTHIRPSPMEILTKLRPAFGGVQTAGNSSAIVDGAAAALVASGDYAKSHQLKPLGRIVAASVVGCPPENMGFGPVSASRPLLEKMGLAVDAIDRWEINEAFAAQCLACERELGIDHARLNVNGGAIAIGHPLGATGVRLAVTVARELKRAGKRYGIASACIGGGQGIAMLVENA
jgi:acetyl-CoA C-acetyltransferase